MTFRSDMRTETPSNEVRTVFGASGREELHYIRNKYNF